MVFGYMQVQVGFHDACLHADYLEACMFFCFFEFAVHPSVGLRYNVQLINTVHTCTNVNSHTMINWCSSKVHDIN